MDRGERMRNREIRHIEKEHKVRKRGGRRKRDGDNRDTCIERERGGKGFGKLG
jgi:hypothetical protein